jgi:type 1 glutamine amidotransferase
MVSSTRPARAHVITGGYPPGAPSGHDHDFARLRLLALLQEAGVPASAANDFADVERWLSVSRLLITYVAGPYPNDSENAAIRAWLEAGGRWLGLHGTSGGRAARVEGETRRRRMVKTSHHETLGAFFLNHPPICSFNVQVADGNDVLTRGLPPSFDVTDELYMIELQQPQSTRVLLTTELASDPSPPGFGFVYDQDTALQPDGKTRVLGYSREVGAGGVAYFALGHCNAPPPRDAARAGNGEAAAPLFRGSWAAPEIETLLRNGIEWGMA